MATRFTETEKTYTYPAIGAMDVTAGVTGNYISMKGYNHAKIDVIMGAIATPSAFTINRATSVTGTSAETWTGWDYVMVNANYSKYNAEDASDTKMQTLTAVTSYTKNTAANNHWTIEFDAIDLGGGAWDCFAPVIAAPSATDIVAVLVTLSSPRYSGVESQPISARTN